MEAEQNNRYRSRNSYSGKHSRNDSRVQGLGDWRPLEVHVVDDNVEKAIRVLKREMGKEGVLKALRQKRYYEKPSEAKKRKNREALRRKRQASRKRNA